MGKLTPSRKVGSMTKSEEIRGALARGYCSERNSHKVLDPDLIEDMAKEIDLWLMKNFSVERIRGVIHNLSVMEDLMPSQVVMIATALHNQLLDNCVNGTELE